MRGVIRERGISRVSSGSRGCSVVGGVSGAIYHMGGIFRSLCKKELMPGSKTGASSDPPRLGSSTFGYPEEELGEK